MNDWLNNLALYLQARGVATVGTDLFQGQFPLSFDPRTNCTVLIPTAGKAGERQKGGGVDFPRVQITCRCTNFAPAWLLARAIYVLLDGSGPFTQGDPSTGTAFQYIKAVQAPFSIGPDDQQAWRIVANYQLEILSSPGVISPTNNGG